MPLSIIHVFRAPIGGLFRHVADLVRGQIARGHKVGIIADSTTGNARSDEIFAELAPQLALGLTRIPMPRQLSPLDAPRHPACHASAFAETGADVIHGHGAKGGAYARLAFPGRKVVRAYTPHGGSLLLRHDNLVGPDVSDARAHPARAPGAVSCSRAPIAANSSARRSASRTASCASSITASSKPNSQPVEPRAGCHRSGLHRRIPSGEGHRHPHRCDRELAPAQSPRDRDAGRRRSGRGRACARRSNGCRCKTPMRFAPVMPARRALTLGKVMVIPSRAESLPYVVLETAAAGMPLITTSVGGIPEIYGPLTDTLVPAGDVRGAGGRDRARLSQTRKQRPRFAQDASRPCRHFVLGRYHGRRRVVGLSSGAGRTGEDGHDHACATKP